jgi:hypothetical protein
VMRVMPEPKYCPLFAECDFLFPSAAFWAKCANSALTFGSLFAHVHTAVVGVFVIIYILSTHSPNYLSDCEHLYVYARRAEHALFIDRIIAEHTHTLLCTKCVEIARVMSGILKSFQREPPIFTLFTFLVICSIFLTAKFVFNGSFCTVNIQNRTF